MTRSASVFAAGFQRVGRSVALIGVALPLLMIGGMKFTQFEIDALQPIISGTPWLAWLYPTFGKAAASYFLGIVEIAAAVLILLSQWSPRAGVFGGALAALTFLVTSSLLLVLPVWEANAGGFPALNILGQFVLKDIALLSIALVIFGESLARARQSEIETISGERT
jgi:reactive chlorine resistance protein C